jgi:hypothetical protein
MSYRAVKDSAKVADAQLSIQRAVARRKAETRMKRPGALAAEALVSLSKDPSDSARVQVFTAALKACGVTSAPNIKDGRDGGGRKMLSVRLATPEDGEALEAASRDAGYVFGPVSHTFADVDGRISRFFMLGGRAAIIWPVVPAEVVS